MTRQILGEGIYTRWQKQCRMELKHSGDLTSSKDVQRPSKGMEGFHLLRAILQWARFELTVLVHCGPDVSDLLCPHEAHARSRYSRGVGLLCWSTVKCSRTGAFSVQCLVVPLSTLDGERKRSVTSTSLGAVITWKISPSPKMRVEILNHGTAKCDLI